MPRLATFLVVLISCGCNRSSSDAAEARPYAKRFGQQLRQDGRFSNVEVGVWELGSKGPIYVRGRVRSNSDAAELRRRFDALGCPVGISWQVVVDTNLNGGSPPSPGA
jgi:hypothetical protein